MASKDQVESWTEEAVCPICLDFFTDPVSLECGHYFCRSCITRRWDREERNSCPECGEEFTDRTLRVSRVVARLSAKARTLSLNRKVKGSIMPVKEAVETNKDPVKAIQSLTKNKSKTQQMEQQQKQKNSGVLRQSHNLQSQITSQFAELRQILAEKEQRVLADIPEEEKQILNRMEKYLQQIQENLNSIENKVKSLQEQLDLKDNVSFLKILTEKEQRILADIRGKVKKVLNTMEKNHGKIEKRLNSIQEDLLKLQQKMGQKDSVVLKEEAGGKRRVSATAKALGVTYSPIEKFDHHFLMNMLWRETSVIKRVFVTLDVETAHPQLEVSDDRKRVRWTWTWKSLPDTAKRFTGCLCVLGSEGFTSGGHYWEVEVAGSRGWGLGVAAESVERKMRVALTPETGVWSIRQWGDGFDAFTSPPSRLPARPIPGRVGVYLSYESGAISFYDADTKSHLHTFTGNKFTEKLYPYFWTWDGNWLRICSGSAPGV